MRDTSYKPRAKRGQNINQSSPGGSYDGRPAEDDPRFKPKKHGNKSTKKRPGPFDKPAFNQRNEQNV